jgi:hypothetical protein
MEVTRNAECWWRNLSENVHFKVREGDGRITRIDLREIGIAVKIKSPLCLIN